MKQIKDGITINVFPTISEAARKTGIDRVGINSCCKGNQKKAGGYNWSYYVG